jgi:hypothetical protein
VVNDFGIVLDLLEDMEYTIAAGDDAERGCFPELTGSTRLAVINRRNEVYNDPVEWIRKWLKEAEHGVD